MKIKVPGKLILMGEYAVLEPGEKGIVMAVDRYLTVHMTDAPTFSVASEPSPFIREGIQAVKEYLNGVKLSIPHVSIRLESGLDDPDTGISYGLGSSAAVTVGIVRGLLVAANDDEPDPMLVFKLAVIAHLRAQGNGSGADIAACAYGGVILYESIDGNWLSQQLINGKNAYELAMEEWSHGNVSELTLPEELGVLVGWTGAKASSRIFINHFEHCPDRSGIYNFVEKTRGSVEAFVDGCKKLDSGLILDAVKRQRFHLKKLATTIGAELETEELTALCDAFETIGAAKFSGAGGGDCAIGFYMQNRRKEKQKIRRTVEAEGMMLLELKIAAL